MKLNTEFRISSINIDNKNSVDSWTFLHFQYILSFLLLLKQFFFNISLMSKKIIHK